MAKTAEETDDDATPPEDDDGGRGGGGGVGDIAGAVADGVKSALAALGIAGPDDEDDDEDDDDVTPTPTTARAVEADTEAQVRAALKKINKEAETDERLAKVEEKTKEQPPVKLRRLTRAFWGDRSHA